MTDDKLIMLARYEPPGWGDPPPCCPRNEHDWNMWRAHPNGVNDVRSCRRHFQAADGSQRECSFSDWRLHEHTFIAWPDNDSGHISCSGLGCPVRQTT